MYLAYISNGQVVNVSEIITNNPLKIKKIFKLIDGWSDNYEYEGSLDDYIQLYNNSSVDIYKVELWTIKELDTYKVSLL